MWIIIMMRYKNLIIKVLNGSHFGVYLKNSSREQPVSKWDAMIAESLGMRCSALSLRLYCLTYLKSILFIRQSNCRCYVFENFSYHQICLSSTAVQGKLLLPTNADDLFILFLESCFMEILSFLCEPWVSLNLVDVDCAHILFHMLRSNCIYDVRRTSAFDFLCCAIIWPEYDWGFSKWPTGLMSSCLLVELTGGIKSSFPGTGICSSTWPSRSWS